MTLPARMALFNGFRNAGREVAPQLEKFGARPRAAIPFSENLMRAAVLRFLAATAYEAPIEPESP